MLDAKLRLIEKNDRVSIIYNVLFLSDHDKYHDGININKYHNLQARLEELITIFETTKLSQ